MCVCVHTQESTTQASELGGVCVGGVNNGRGREARFYRMG